MITSIRFGSLLNFIVAGFISVCCTVSTVQAAEETGRIGDFIWNDLNQNGLQDLSESGMSNVLIEVHECGGDAKYTRRSNADGVYYFDVPAEQNYLVRVHKPVGCEFTVPFAGDTALDSNINPDTGEYRCVSLTPGRRRLWIDAGLVCRKPSASIGNFVFWDHDRDGVRGKGEQGVPFVPVTLQTCDGEALVTQLTSDNGFYRFRDLDAGCYVIAFDLPSDTEFTIPDNSTDTVDSDADPLTGLSHPITLAADQRVSTVDAGLVEMEAAPSSIGDRVFLDENLNGIQEPGESGVSNVAVNLLDCDGSFLERQSTDNNGQYAFDIQPGKYIVEFENPLGFLIGLRDQGEDDTADSDADPVSGQTECIDVKTGEFQRGVDAGLF